MGFFVVIIVIALYEDWRPFLIAIAFVVVHHGAIGVVAPTGAWPPPKPLSWDADGPPTGTTSGTALS